MADSTATLLSPLLKCFHSVPPAAIPAILDCVLASSNISPPLLFDSLLSSFSIVIDGIDKDTDKLLGSEQCKILVAYSRSLSHLLKNSGVYSIALESFTWKAFVPLMKMGNLYGRETLNEIQDSFLETVKVNNSWAVVKATLVPFLLRSVDISMDSLQNTSIIERSKHVSDVKFHAPVGGEDLLSVSSSFPLSISCHTLSSLLDAALQSYQAQGSFLDLPLRGGSRAEVFLRNLLWDLCDITIRMLPQSSAHRSCAVGLLFPSILNAFADVSSFEVTAGEKTFNLSRNYFLRKMWECCSVLFSLGHVERRDAYGIISLYLSYVPCVDRFEVEVADRAEEFDITAEKQFWDEIRRGLVSKESLVRKQSLQILKKVLLIKDETHLNSNIPDKKSHHEGPVPVGMTKRDVWAEKEAMSLGVGKMSTALDPSLSEPQKWEAFILLYEMLEEYGTHLVEAAWNHQIVLLLNSCQQDGPLNSAYGGFGWLAILWERGLFHENPLVRCLIMESFLDIHWENQRNLTQLFPEDFLLGPFVEGLNDPVHHKDFGVKGIYTSMTIVGASLFLQHYCSLLSERILLSFLSKLASVAKRKSLGRAGLMALADCIYSASNCSIVSMAEKDSNGRYQSKCEMDDLVNSDGVGSLEVGTCHEKANLIDGLRLLVEVSKQHFNPCYRLKVCEKLVRAGALVVCTHELPLEMILLFVAALPRDFIDAGPLRSQLQGWLLGCGKKDCIARCTTNKMQLQLRLLEFPKEFTSQTYHADFLGEYDDEDIIAWGTKSERWARVLFLLIKEEPPLQALFLFLKEIDISINQKNNSLRWIPVKFLIIILSLVHELEIIWRKADPGLKLQDESGVCLHEEVYRLDAVEASLIQISSENFLSVLEDLTSFAITSCSIFWSGVVGGSVDLPGAVIGKLGGPCRRRLSSSLTTTVLQAIMFVKTAACLSSWCSRVRESVDLIVPHTFLWEFIWKAVSKPVCQTETSAEIQLATYEALGSVLKALAPMFSSLTIKLIQKANGVSSPPEETMPLLDCLVLSFLTHCNKLLGSGQLSRSRVAVLLNWKWLCIESLLSMPYHALQNGVNLRSSRYFFSSNVVECIFYDLVESLEDAADDSALPMLRSIRLVLDMLTTDGPFLSSRCMVDVQMMWQLVRSSWILHSSCKKRRVAPISALLSSVLHASVFRDESMHVADNADGPLKWFCGKVLEEGTKSPRTIRLAALHLTGLWLLNPLMIKHYVKELKVFTLYGSVAFDEDFESELTENGDARAEVSLLAKSPDPEITEVFINTELYARVSVAVLFHKLGGLAEMVGSENENEDSCVALEAGKLFLLALLDSVVNDNDLAKELYKKYSAIHRRKVRVWQMLCILSPFVDEYVIQHVMHGLHTAIHRNNLPSVRQYMESFAINLYLKFPQLVKEHLVPLLSDYHMKTQALASYVFIAANVILHASEALQSQHLEKLLPPIVPLLTSHQHTLRGFTQLLVFKVLSEKLPALETTHFEMVPLEKKCFADLKSYLGLNPDCVRLRSSMEVFLDTFDPKHAVTPAGIFSNRVEALEFECVSMSLMEQVINFLNDAREDLRDAMAKDDVTIKNESLKSAASLNLTNSPVRQSREELSGYSQIKAPLDFQKKFTLLKHEKENDSSRSLLDHLEIYKPLAELEKEDKLLVQMLQSRVSSMEKLRANRQEITVVASLIDRIPNLAGLARTCEVFKATGLVVADAKVLQDRQFQLISVTAEKWIPIVEVPVNSVKTFLEKKKREGFSILGLEQTANSIALDKYEFPKKTVLVLGREKEGIPVDLIHILDACLEIPQLGVVRSLNVHVSGAIALWEYTRQQRAK